MIKEKSLKATIIGLNIILMIVTYIIVGTTENVSEVKRNKETLNDISSNNLREEIREYKDELAKELFDFQLIALVKKESSNNILEDLYGKDINNMDITTNEIEKILKKEFSDELDNAISKVEEYIKKYKVKEDKEKELYALENSLVNTENHSSIPMNKLLDGLKSLQEVNKYIIKDNYKKAKDYITKNNVIGKLNDSKILSGNSVEAASIIIESVN